MEQAGVYIHIPFCRARCSYCDFATGMYEGDLANRYVSAVVREIEDWREIVATNEADTLYFGGGTPSLLTAEQVSRILEGIHPHFQLASRPEITIEINPGELDSSRLQAFHHLGINRASFGAQTFDDRQLRQLGRTHTSDDIRKTFQYLREAGFENINFDLIAGLPGQTLENWQRNLSEALALRPEHLSLYLLDVHEGTPLAEQIRRGAQPKPDDDLAAEMYRVMIENVC